MLTSWIRWIAGLGVCFAGILFNADFLIRIGVMRTSLTSSHDTTRVLAQAEVMVLQLGAVAFGLALIFLAPRLPAFAQRPAIRPLLNPLPGNLVKHQQTLLNWQLIVLLLASVGMVASLYAHTEVWRLTAEDGPFEQLTACSFLLAGGIGIWACLRRGRAWTTVPLALMAAFFVVAAGEEVSWGQRVFGHETPEFMAKHNVQGETNLHNLFGYVTDHAFIAGTLIYGALLPLASLRWPALHRFMWRVGFPVASAGLALGFLVLSLVHSWTVGHAGGPWAAVRVPEIREALAGLAYLLLMLETLSTDRAVATGAARFDETDAGMLQLGLVARGHSSRAH